MKETAQFLPLNEVKQESRAIGHERNSGPLESHFARNDALRLTFMEQLQLNINKN
jgi:hypothetical protein